MLHGTYDETTAVLLTQDELKKLCEALSFYISDMEGIKSAYQIAAMSDLYNRLVMLRT